MMNKYQKMLHKLDDLDRAEEVVEVFAAEIENAIQNIDIQTLDDFCSDDPDTIRRAILNCSLEVWLGYRLEEMNLCGLWNSIK